MFMRLRRWDGMAFRAMGGKSRSGWRASGVSLGKTRREYQSYEERLRSCRGRLQVNAAEIPNPCELSRERLHAAAMLFTPHAKSEVFEDKSPGELSILSLSTSKIPRLHRTASTPTLHEFAPTTSALLLTVRPSPGHIARKRAPREAVAGTWPWKELLFLVCAYG